MLAAGTYRGRLGGQVYQDEDGSTGLSGLGVTVRQDDTAPRSWIRLSLAEFNRLIVMSGIDPRANVGRDVTQLTQDGHFYVRPSMYAHLQQMARVAYDMRTANQVGQAMFRGVYADAGQTSGQYGPARTAVFGRTKLMYTLRQQQTMREHDLVRYSQAQAREQFSTGMHPVAKAAVGVGLGGIAGALLAAALL